MVCPTKMPSLVWGRDPEDAFQNPYEYEAQIQFVREASNTLLSLNALLATYTMQFHRDDTSLEKASWMLALDLVDSLHESLKLLEERRHRIAFRLFRDAVETIDLLKVLHANNQQAVESLSSWYKDITPGHIKSRKYIEETLGKDAAAEREKYYKQVSKFTHRTYRALLDGFSLGSGNMMVHDSHSKSGILVLPHTIALGHAVLADLIIQAILCLSKCSILKSEEVISAFLTSLETKTIPRRFEAR